VLLLAVLLDAAIMRQLAAAFDVTSGTLTLPALALRAAINAAVGMPLFAVVERRQWRWGRA
jgi:hypothetical protein